MHVGHLHQVNLVCNLGLLRVARQHGVTSKVFQLQNTSLPCEREGRDDGPKCWGYLQSKITHRNRIY